MLPLLSFQTFSYSKNKSDNIKPRWVTQSIPESMSKTYIFVASHGTGSSLEAARQSALIHLTSKLEDEHGLIINSTFQTRTTNTTTTYGSQGKRESVLETIAKEAGREVNIVCRIIDEYWVISNGQYDIDVLYTVADKNVYGGSYDDNITVSSKYGVAGFLSVVPGVGQFYKGDKLKGSLILGGEIIAAGGIILCENTRASYAKKMIEQPKHASEYNSLADTWETGRNICIGAAAAIYIYNLIDAFTAIGAKRIIVEKRKTTLSAMPYLDNQSMGVGLVMNF